MGLLITTPLCRYLAPSQVKVLLVGLDAAGKTTVLYQLALGKVVTTIPTMGFNVETIEWRNLRMTIWDVGGQLKLRKLWRHYSVGTQGVIFLVDSSDLDRAEDAREELQSLLQDDDLRDACLLVYANKQDLPQALPPAEVAAKLGLNAMLHRPWFIQSTCATRGEGIHEGLEWLSGAVQRRR
mmetsp:Transcript_49640/g.106344  ORF Transcript_49640/g.106344 Transcript_49640/m.106344 type:complete len:182 (+) Transcript_49640:54-599(+)